MVYESRIYSSTSPRPVISTSYSYSPNFPVEEEEMYYQSPNYFYVQLPIPMLPPAASPVGPIPVVTKIHRQPHLVLAISPGSNKGHVINPIAIPRVAHKRLVTVSAPPRRVTNGQNYYELLESGMSGHYGTNRIILVNYKPPPVPVTQSKVMYIEDVTDPGVSRLLRREHSPSPSFMYGSPWDMSMQTAMVPIPKPMFSLHNVPLRSASEVKEIADLRRLYVRDRNPDVGYSPLNKALLYRMPSPSYVDPTIPRNYYIGSGNLACLSFAGGRPIPKRRRFYPEYDDKIRDEVVFRSFYTKLRNAASAGRNAGKRPIYQPIYYSKKTILGEENVPKREPKESKWVERAMKNEKPYTPKPKPPPLKVSDTPIATEAVITPPRKQSLKMEQAPATPPSVKPVNITLPGPRKSITEIIKDDIPKVENLPEESVTVKMPKQAPNAPSTPVEDVPKPPPKEATPPPPKEATPPPPKEATPPPKEVTPPPQKEATPPPQKEATPPPQKEATPPPQKEATPPPQKEATPPPQKEATPPPQKEATPPPQKEATPPPQKEATPPPQKEATPPPVAAEEIPAETQLPAEPISEEVSPPAMSEQGTGDEASNKGEVEDIQLDEDITLDEVCDVEENDLEIESDCPEMSQPVAAADETQQIESPKEIEGPNNASDNSACEVAAPAETAPTPVNDQDAVSATPVSIVVADIDGPLQHSDDEEAVQEETLTVEQIQELRSKRQAEFSKLLDEHAELVSTVKHLERVRKIVTQSCEEALAQHEDKPSSSEDSHQNK